MDKYAHLASREEIAENDYNLNIPRYVDTFKEEEEIDLMAVRAEREKLKAELAVLEERMAGYLKELGMSEQIKGGNAESHIAVFQEQTIRRTWHQNQWWFSVVDVVGILSGSNIARRYWSDLKRKLAQEAGSEQPYEKIVQLKLTAPDGKQRETDCADTETLLRSIQSIPSPKAEAVHPRGGCC